MSSWLRLDPGFVTHPKIALLTDRQFRVWMRVLANAASTESAIVNEGTMREIAGLDQKSVDRFTELRLLDRNGSAWNVHDWSDYAPPLSGAERTRRYRNRRRDDV